MTLKVPSKFSEEDSELVKKLHDVSLKSPKLIKSSSYPAPADPKVIIRSWKMNEFKYYQIPSPFPTLARGIFTTELPSVKDGDPQESNAKADDIRNEKLYRIVVRGYDKFFNIGEVPWCTWPTLAERTAAPYILSLKSNGCIIFIAALTPAKLLITSKHSIGPVEGSLLSHAQAGERWLCQYLKSKGRTEEQLALHLWENNWTAIAELCDDSFEEHVLPYPSEKTGLHLHGLNECTKDFNTLPHERVDSFAEEWGFIKTPTLTFNSIGEVRSFTDDIGQTGRWNGEPVEGFVVRTHVTEPVTREGGPSTASPYAPGSSFFFKVKFDEPYMMYRDWREVTKSLLSTKGKMTPSSLPKSKMKRPETKLYVNWVIEEIKKDRSQFAEYSKGKGIIATRERFLKWLSTEQGEGSLKTVKSSSGDIVTIENSTKDFEKTIIVPVAIPGCGKTSVAVALAFAFGFGHTQSDDVHMKKPAPHFIRNVASLLKNYDVVIADKNNHLRQHRTALREVAEQESVSTRLLALNWAVAEKPQSTVHRVCGDRVTHRGDNHQTLRADTSSAKGHEDIIWEFIRSSEELSKDEVDAILEMDMEDDLVRSVNRAVDGVVRVLRVERPTEEKIAEALSVAMAYKPHTKNLDCTSSKKKKGGPRYYALLPELDLESVLEEHLRESDDEPDEPDPDLKKAAEMYRVLKESGRVTKLPHVTIVHTKSLPADQELWDKCVKLNALSEPPLFKMKLGHLIWDDSVLAVTVDVSDVVGEGDGLVLGKEFLQGLDKELKTRFHITVGTQDDSIRAVEGKKLVENWKKDNDESRTLCTLELGDVELQGRLKCLR